MCAYSNLFEYYANYNLGLHFYYKIDIVVVVIVKIKLIFYFNIIIIIIVKQNEIDIKKATKKYVELLLQKMTSFISL